MRLPIFRPPWQFIPRTCGPPTPTTTASIGAFELLLRFDPRLIDRLARRPQLRHHAATHPASTPAAPCPRYRSTPSATSATSTQILRAAGIQYRNQILCLRIHRCSACPACAVPCRAAARRGSHLRPSHRTRRLRRAALHAAPSDFNSAGDRHCHLRFAGALLERLCGLFRRRCPAASAAEGPLKAPCRIRGSRATSVPHRHARARQHLQHHLLRIPHVRRSQLRILLSSTPAGALRTA